MKLYMFRTVPLSIIRSYSLYTQQWCMSHRFLGSFRAAENGHDARSRERKKKSCSLYEEKYGTARQAHRRHSKMTHAPCVLDY
jgi:hypothetical protein